MSRKVKISIEHFDRYSPRGPCLSHTDDGSGSE